MILFLIKICLMLMVMLLCGYFVMRYQKKTPIPAPPHTATHSFHLGWGIAITISILVIYAALACLFSSVWLKGDDYIFLPWPVANIKEMMFFVAGRYTDGNSRVGELLGGFVGLSENRWQHWLLTPAIILSIPFAMHRLFGKQGESITNFKGFCFIWFCIGMILMNADLHPWRNFWCYAVIANYLWPIPAIILFLSFYREGRWKSYQSSSLSIIGLFILGLYCGWALECVSIFLVPGLIIYCIWRCRKQKYIPWKCWSGLAGSIWGAFLLYASPAPGRRAARELAESLFDTSNMTFSQLLEFCTNLTPERLDLLQGAHVQYFLGGIPLPLHIFFVPQLISHYLPCCALALGAILFMMLFFIRKGTKKKDLIITTSGIMLSFLCACSYLYACIPNNVCFQPASFIMIGTACFLFQRTILPIIVRPFMAIAVVIYACYILFPAGAEAWAYRETRSLRMAELHKKLAQGEKNITLHLHWLVPPKDPLGLITCMELGDDPQQYPNFLASRAYGVDSIILMKEKASQK